MEQTTPSIRSFRNVCRLCLSKNQALVDVFSFSSKLKCDIVDVLVACVPIHISVYDDLPRTICTPCSIMVEEFYKFQQLAVKSERTLHNYLNSSEPKNLQRDNYDENFLTREEIKTEPIDYQNNTTQTTFFYNNQNELCYNEHPDIKTEPTEVEYYHQHNETYTSVQRIHSEIKPKEEPLLQDMDSDPEKSSERAVRNELVNCRPSIICNRSIKQEPIDQINEPDQQRTIHQAASEEVNNHGACQYQQVPEVPQFQQFNISYRCLKCLECFNTKSQLANHKKNYTCDVRNTGLSYKETIKHKCTDLYCKICCTKFENENSFDIHNSSMHSDQKKIKNNSVSAATSCDLKRLRQSGEQTNSTKRKCGEKYYECEVCNSLFANKIDFLTHKTVHKQYRCGTCSVHFTEESNLTIHAKVHFGERPHICDICNKSFSQHDNLVAHKRTHKLIK